MELKLTINGTNTVQNKYSSFADQYFQELEII